MTRGVRYYSYPDHSGYGLAALGYVRALHNAGVPVWWTPLIYRDGRHHPMAPRGRAGRAAHRSDATNDAALQDLVALIAATGMKPCDTAIVHAVPEHWPAFVERGKRNVRYTVWETDTLPAHWPPLLDVVDKILVPSAANKALFESAGIAASVTAVRTCVDTHLARARRTAARCAMSLACPTIISCSIRSMSGIRARRSAILPRWSPAPSAATTR